MFFHYNTVVNRKVRGSPGENTSHRGNRWAEFLLGPFTNDQDMTQGKVGVKMLVGAIAELYILRWTGWGWTVHSEKKVSIFTDFTKAYHIHSTLTFQNIGFFWFPSWFNPEVPKHRILLIPILVENLDRKEGNGR